MRKLIFALAAAGAIAFAAPANAQSFYAGFGPSWGYGYGYAPNYWDNDYVWAGPPAVGYTTIPAARAYEAPRRTYVAVRERPRVVRRIVRERRIVRTENPYAAYAYSPGVPAYSAPYVGFGVGFGPGYGWWR
jgi:hypothetical protein